MAVFEKKSRLGKESCSGLFSERILEFIPQSRELIQNKIDFALIRFPKKTLKIKFPLKFFVMDHAELDRKVAGLAEKEGARIIFNNPIEKSGFIRDLINKGANRIIGCDGYNSFVRKEMGGRENINFRATIQGFLIEKNNSNFVETWPIESGFIWKIPRGEETEYGIIAKPGAIKGLVHGDKNSVSDFSSTFKEFLNKNKIQLKKIQGAVVPQGFCLPKNEIITLCGDAAGLTKPWSGGGVVWGLIAADILLKNFPDFIKYRIAMKKFFLPRIIFSKIATRMVYSAGFNFPWIMPKNIKVEGDFLV